MTHAAAPWLMDAVRWLVLLCLLHVAPAWSACDEAIATWRVKSVDAKGANLSRSVGQSPELVLPATGTGWLQPGMLLQVASPQIADCKGVASRIVGGEMSGRVAVLNSAASLVLQPREGDATVAGADTGRITLAVPELQRAKLQGVHVGDLVRLRYSCSAGCPKGPDGQAELSDLRWQTDQPGAAWRWGAMLGSAMAVFLLAMLLTWRKPWLLVLGEDSRYSTSKFQMLLWFWAVISAYLAFSVLRVVSGDLSFLGGIELPNNLLLLSGISALSFATAKAITVSKVDAAGDLGTVSKPAADKSSLTDLVKDDQQRLALGDFQVVLLTVVAIAIYMGIVWQALGTIELRHSASLPDLDGALLGLLGLGNAGYLGVKAASDPGGGITPQQAKLQAQELLDTASKLLPPLEATAKQAKAEQTDLASTASQAPDRTKLALETASSEANSRALAVSSQAAAGPECIAQVSAAVGRLAQLHAKWSQHAEAGPTVVKAMDDAKKLQQLAQELAQQINAAAAASTASARAVADELARRQ